jgi:hypothetical protein
MDLDQPGVAKFVTMLNVIEIETRISRKPTHAGRARNIQLVPGLVSPGFVAGAE